MIGRESRIQLDSLLAYICKKKFQKSSKKIKKGLYIFLCIVYTIHENQIALASNERRIEMNAIAKETMKNGYGETLFTAGKSYEVIRIDSKNKKCYLPNDMGWESPMKMRELKEKFETIEE